MGLMLFWRRTMRIDKLWINSFKNLKDLTIDIDQSQMTSVFIGKNGAGKSNVIEALIIIFRDLDLDVRTTDFSYDIKYQCSGFNIHVTNSVEEKKREFYINKQKTSSTKFYQMREYYLPSHVFAYYSGSSNRLENLFSQHQKKFYTALLSGEEEAMRPLFYARLIHSNFVLLAFFSFFEEQNMAFMKEYFEIEAIDSILFVLHKANWVKEKKNQSYHKGEFWGARGVVREFLDDLYQYSLAPIKETAVFDEDFKKVNKEVTYLYIKDQKQLIAFAQKYGNNTEFFKHLESTYLSDLIEEIRIKVRKTDGTVITFSELSEGEQQLLTVMGLLKFTKSEESLILLDEPDTHLNPSWKYNYLQLIKDVAGQTESSQVIVSTHDPIVIGGLRKEAVTIFDREDGKTVAKTPENDPKGMGVAGLLTSDLFGLPTTLDIETQKNLDRKRQLQFKKEKTESEAKELAKLEKELQTLGFSRTTRDPLYDKFIEKVYSRPEFQSKEITEEERKQMLDLTNEILAEIEKEEENDIH